MAFAALIIDLPDDHMFIALDDLAESDAAARVGWVGKPLDQVYCRGRQQRRIDAVVVERRHQRDLASGIARRSCDGSPVAGQHRRRRNERNSLNRRGTHGGRLVASKKEQFILDDRPAEHSAKLIALQRIPLRSEYVAGVHRAIPYEFKEIAVKLVRSALRYGVDRRRGVLSVLSL